MCDRRVVRGNTYALPLIQTCAPKEPQRPKRKNFPRKANTASPSPVKGRLHIEVQTELYLEELSERVEEIEAEIQTDTFIDRPKTPLFIPAKTGLDVTTQIYEGDLFDFDIEVVPILEVIVGKTIEQSLLEIMEEEELANLREQQRHFEELRSAELVEQQRLEEHDRRQKEEGLKQNLDCKENRISQQRATLLVEKETARKMAARALAKSYLTDLVPSVFDGLRKSGYFYDPVERGRINYCFVKSLNGSAFLS
ncbi:LOW QUALITY PROTEIN: radial spoke head protein 3 homolog [Octopus sinensis]|uniref:LOW QUALITY PROTEIN: radial spoke head protein 3 homolog n=1 Tax=Octopus sinensis TaxID=2607531 RepID=A0A6P7TWK6_9MOLL|nr:LOW QUALITY PROTEIN: radial spoke head protein 3 homolog [Octopus sinensis]